MFDNISITLTSASCVLVVVFVLKFAIPLFQERKHGQEVLHNVDGLKTHWLFGHIFETQPTAESFQKLRLLSKNFPKIGRFWIGPFVWYLSVTHPHVIKPVLATSEPKDRVIYGFLRDWIGDGLLVSSGKKWHRNRHLLTRAFHFDILRDYAKLFNECANTMLNKWTLVSNNEMIEVFGDVTLMALDNMLQCTMSCTTHCQTNKVENNYASAVCSLGEIVTKRFYNPIIHPDFIFYLTPIGRKFKRLCKLVHDFDENVINERKRFINTITGNMNEGASMTKTLTEEDLEMYKKLSGRNLDFLDILLLTRDEDGKGLSDREVRDEVDTFLFEGHDTTASGISWALYCLAAYPEYQEKCREEIQNILGDKENVDWKDLENLSYLSMFIKEVLRMYPPVLTIGRNLTKPLTFPRGFNEDQYCLDDVPPSNSSRTFKPPASILIPLYFLHYNLSIWKNPEVFDPQRFSPENSKLRSSHAFLPFSAGPRNCIGKNFAMAEIKITLCKALQQFRFFVDEECPKPEILPSVTLKAKDGIYVKVKSLV